MKNRDQLMQILGYLERVTHARGILASDVATNGDDTEIGDPNLLAVWRAVDRTSQAAGFEIVVSDFGKIRGIEADLRTLGRLARSAPALPDGQRFGSVNHHFPWVLALSRTAAASERETRRALRRRRRRDIATEQQRRKERSGGNE